MLPPLRGDSGSTGSLGGDDDLAVSLSAGASFPDGDPLLGGLPSTPHPPLADRGDRATMLRGSTAGERYPMISVRLEPLSGPGAPQDVPPPSVITRTVSYRLGEDEVVRPPTTSRWWHRLLCCGCLRGGVEAPGSPSQAQGAAK